MNTIKGQYIGYIWWSNAKTPEVYDEAKTIDIVIEDNINPFIIEGMLWDKDNNISVTIKNIDGKCQISSVCVNDFKSNVKFTEKKFIAHRIKNASKLIFRQYWELKPNKDCLNMDVYIPTKLLFVGFEK